MTYKQFNNPLSRKTSPLLKTSPLNETKSQFEIDLEADLPAAKATDAALAEAGWDSSDDTDYGEQTVVEGITGIVLGIDDTLGKGDIRETLPMADTSLLDTKLGKKALESRTIASNENVDRVERNIAERRGRRQGSRAERKRLRKTMPAGKERRELIKKTRENQGRKPENMV